MQTIPSKGLCAGSLFKVIFTGLFFPIVILGIGCGIAAFFGHDTVTLNEEHVYGITGLLVGMAIGIFVPVIMGIILTIFMAPSIWLWTRFRHITLNIKE